MFPHPTSLTFLRGPDRGLSPACFCLPQHGKYSAHHDNNNPRKQKDNNNLHDKTETAPLWLSLRHICKWGLPSWAAASHHNDGQSSQDGCLLSSLACYLL